MRLLALVFASCLASGCVIHIRGDAAEPAYHSSSSPVAAHEARSVRGVVVGADGAPVAARVAIVSRRGSLARTAAADGRFELESSGDETDLVVHASADGARVAYRRVRPGDEGVRLELAPGATVAVTWSGTTSVRCAVLHDGARIEDFSVRAQETASVVVPAGTIRLLVYGGPGEEIERELQVAAGGTARVEFQGSATSIEVR